MATPADVVAEAVALLNEQERAGAGPAGERVVEYEVG